MVGVQLDAGFTVRTADAEPLLVAEIVTKFVALTAAVLTVKSAPLTVTLPIVSSAVPSFLIVNSVIDDEPTTAPLTAKFEPESI